MGSCLQDRKLCEYGDCLEFVMHGADVCERHISKKMKRCGYPSASGDPCTKEVWTGHCSYHKRVEEEKKKAALAKAEAYRLAEEAKREAEAAARKKEQAEREIAPLHEWLEEKA